jgi:hypothetical protein
VTDSEQPSSGQGYWAAPAAATAYPTRAQPSAGQPSAPANAGAPSPSAPAPSRRRLLQTWPIAAAILIGAAAITTAVVVTSGGDGSAPATPAAQSSAPAAPLTATDTQYLDALHGADKTGALAGDADGKLVALGRAACRHFDDGHDAVDVLAATSRAGSGQAANDLVSAAVGTYCDQYRYLLG